MRTIKFRAWDKDANLMWGDVGVLPEDTPYEISMIKETQKPIFKLSTKNITIMQFTGLLDKNGKEIFEGDILTPFRYRKTEEFNGNIIFDCGMFRFQIDKKFHTTMIPLSQSLKMSDRANNSYIIIGNIYENPKLLKNE